MWQNIFFEACPDSLFQYKYDDSYFYVKCEIFSQKFTDGNVYACCGSSKLNLGTLKGSQGLLSLDKSYPLAYLRSHGIEINNLTHFSLSAPDGFYINSNLLSAPDPAITRAEKLLSSMSRPASPGEADEHIHQIRQLTLNLPKENLPFLPEYEWYRVSDIKQTFSLSAIEHIVFTPSFMQSFVRSGCWFLGDCSNTNIFALCIATDSSFPNPMENALDCCRTFPTISALYCVVGIGLFEDGQYFCKI